MSTQAALLEENRRLAEIVVRQDKAIDEALAVLAHLAQTGSCPKELRERGRTALLEARNERIPRL